MIIKSVNLTKDIPVVQFSTVGDAQQSTDSTFPGKDSERIPPAASFESAVELLLQAFQECIEEFGCDEDRIWKVQSVAYVWDAEYAEYGFRVKLTGSKIGALSLDVTAKESSPDQVDDRVYAALEKLKYEAERFVQGVSAQLNLLDVRTGKEVEEEAA